MLQVLVVKTGNATPSVKVALGDYDRWFLRSLSPSGVRFRVVEPHLGAALPAQARGHDAVIVTGSPHSVTDGEPWMRRTGDWLREAAAQRVPVLGVCFGHQLLAQVFGAAIRKSPRGREIGTITCALTDAGRADPLFEDLPPAFAVQATHEDEVVDPPPELEILAASGHTAIQAFRLGRSVRAVQFHPEIDAAGMQALVLARLPALQSDARERGLALLCGIRPTPAGRRILENFLRLA